MFDRSWSLELLIYRTLADRAISFADCLYCKKRYSFLKNDRKLIIVEYLEMIEILFLGRMSGVRIVGLYNFLIFFIGLKKNCAEIYEAGGKIDGMYTIKPDNLLAFDVFCDQTTKGGGWTVFQKRLNGSVDFYRYWNDYKCGFGDLNGEFWLGLDKIHRLTSDDNNVLRIDLGDFEGNNSYAEYDLFGVKSEKDKYKLILGSYSGRTVILSLLV